MKRVTRERWLPVVGYEGRYDVSDRGRVRSYYHGRWLKNVPLPLPIHVSPQGYHIVCLSTKGTLFRATVSRLVLEAFEGPHPDGKPYALHKNGDPSNNTLPNLRWGSNAENQADRVTHGTSNKGEANGMARLTESDVSEIKRRLRSGEKQVRIAIDFNVDTSLISGINIGRVWKHVR